MDENSHDDTLNLDSSATIDLGRLAAAQGRVGLTDSVIIPEKPPNVRCETRQREFLSHHFEQE
jgi:hypothetical protein